MMVSGLAREKRPVHLGAVARGLTTVDAPVACARAHIAPYVHTLTLTLTLTLTHVRAYTFVGLTPPGSRA